MFRRHPRTSRVSVSAQFTRRGRVVPITNPPGQLEDPARKTVERRGFDGCFAKDRGVGVSPVAHQVRVEVKMRHEGVFVVGGVRDINSLAGALVGERVGD